MFELVSYAVTISFMYKLTYFAQAVIESYPVLTDRRLFPKLHYVPAGSEIEFMCQPERSDNSRTKFYINDQLVTDG